MLRAFVFVFLALSGVVAPRAAAQTLTSLVSDADIERLGFRRQWEAHLPVPAGVNINNAYLVDEVLYVTTSDGALHSIEADLGLIRWVERITEPAFRIYRPSHVLTPDGKGPTVVLNTSGLLVLDCYNGGQLLQVNPGFPPGGAPLMLGNNYYAGSGDGRFYALSIVGCPKCRAYKKWEVAVGGPVTANPLLYEGDKLLFASEAGSVYSCFAADKTLLWSYRTGGGIIGNPALDAGGVYVASLDRTLYKLSLRGGRPIWRVRFDDPLQQGPAVVAHTVYQYSHARGVTALDADTGNRRWANEEASQFVAHSRAQDVLYSKDRRLLIVDHESGEPAGAIGMPHAIGAVTNTVNDAVYVLGTQGRVLCLRIDDVPYLRRQQVQAARSQLNQPPGMSPLNVGPFPEVPKRGENENRLDPLLNWRERARQ